MVGDMPRGGMLTTSEVARLLNLHVNTVRRWSNQEILMAYRIGTRGDRRFRQEDITGSLRRFNKNRGSHEQIDSNQG